MYTQSVHCQLLPEHADAFAAQLALASTVYTKDPGTLAWIVQRSTVDPCSFLISEVYATEQDHATHQANPFFAEFMATCKPWLTAYKGRDGQRNRWRGEPWSCAQGLEIFGPSIVYIVASRAFLIIRMP